MKKTLLGFYAIFIFCGCAMLNRTPSSENVVLNDIHSKLNSTQVAKLVSPQSVDDIRAGILFAKNNDLKVSISGGRHSMGGQQFGDGNFHFDMARFNNVIALDQERGIVEVQSGIQWPKLIKWLNENQKGVSQPWVILQKQTGADRMSIGGALSTNIHGRGLTLKPIIQDVESFTLINADGRLIECSRTKNQELFSLVIGGYGLFGVIAHVKLRLVPRERLVRHVEIATAREIPRKVENRINDGYMYGDFQFGTDPNSQEFLNEGVFSFYKPVPVEDNPKDPPAELGEEDWSKLLVLGHVDKKKAYDTYTQYYLSTNNYRYWSDTHQLSVYLDDYHLMVDKSLGAKTPGSEMISEVYVSREMLPEFMRRAARQFRKHDVNVIYGTVRFIEKDDESFLPWAKKDYASIVFNFHVDHSPEGIEKVKADYLRLFDLALSMNGNFFLTYHRWATKAQIKRGYPNFQQFLKKKKEYDPTELFDSNWYRHYKELLK